MTNAPRKRKPRTIREIAQHKAWLARKKEAKQLNCLENEVLDRKAEAVWARLTDPTYYDGTHDWAKRRNVDCEPKRNYHTAATGRRESI